MWAKLTAQIRCCWWRSQRDRPEDRFPVGWRVCWGHKHVTHPASRTCWDTTRTPGDCSKRNSMRFSHFTLKTSPLTAWWTQSRERRPGYCRRHPLSVDFRRACRTTGRERGTWDRTRTAGSPWDSPWKPAAPWPGWSPVARTAATCTLF